MKNWLTLILGLPTANATERMRAWRALKASGAAVLRDGAYLLPDTGVCREALASVERDILAINGTAYVLPVVDSHGERFVELFDRSEDYTKLRTEIEACRAQLNAERTHWPPPSRFASCAKPTNNWSTSITFQVSRSSKLIWLCRS